MKLKGIIAISILVIMLGIGFSVEPVSAAAESVRTKIYFNVGAVDELTVTLLGESAATSSASGTATTKNIEFNSSDGSDEWLNATVGPGGATQDATNPIIIMDNTGTTVVNLNISTDVNVTASAACMNMSYSAEQEASCVLSAGGANADPLNNTVVTLNSSYTPAGDQYCLWLWGNFSSCIDADDTSVWLFMNISTV